MGTQACQLGGWPVPTAPHVAELGLWATRLFLYPFLLFFPESIYRRGARRWRKLYRANGHLFQAKRFNRVSCCRGRRDAPTPPRQRRCRALPCAQARPRAASTATVPG